MIPGVLGHSLNSNITHKFLCGRPVFPDYFSVSYDYGDNNKKMVWVTCKTLSLHHPSNAYYLLLTTISIETGSKQNYQHSFCPTDITFFLASLLFSRLNDFMPCVGWYYSLNKQIIKTSRFRETYKTLTLSIFQELHFHWEYKWAKTNVPQSITGINTTRSLSLLNVITEIFPKKS